MASRPLSRLPRPYICPSCHTCRQFTTTPSLSAISPESPRYIDIPTPPQQDYTPPKRVKGILPVPRDVMKHRTPAKVESRLHSPAKPHEPSNPQERFSARMTALRKDNLRAGASALYARRNAAIKTSRERSAADRAARDKALAAPEHWSDRLTGATLDDSVRAELARYATKSGSLPDPGRAERVAATKERLAAEAEGLQLRRRDALHSLYMNARTFIVDEKGLNEAIDQAFGTVEEPYHFGNEKPSMWTDGPPPRMSDLALGVAGIGKGALQRDAQLGRMEILRDRVRRMAEGVTGGKMDA
ncbi:hypothetical protein K461DRAFT_294812 [Myriangium duriaei CBS 260.36]|uniref:Uncharacterized protein n=1 Tax=Myriangium duriaei CBS 260.36 TaxID=1168546 RepID=A0A9P4MGB0_9PEZI|nr:hypothetical protein K461DRAFT_294812 [Myriangium duriaei CBS 260.36]